MSVERNIDGNITIKDNNGVGVIFRTVKVSYDKQEEKFQHWVDDCAKRVTACSHTFKETEHYLLENCDALPLALKDRCMKSFHCNVIMSHCKDKLQLSFTRGARPR